jgi:RNA polymerase sigma-70 factor (ECF subfamily)
MATSSEVPLDRPAISLGSPSRTQTNTIDLASLEDSVLITQAQAGEREAFDVLVHRYDRDVLRLILRVVHDPEQASDLYQESFLRIYRNLHRFRLESSFYTWTYRIVTNVCLDYLRRRRSRPEDQSPATDVDGLRAHPADFFDRRRDTQANPEQQLLGQEIGEHIDAALQRLSPRERMIFEMKHYQGLKLRAIGDALGTTEETVKNSLFRATQKLRLQLQELY